MKLADYPALAELSAKQRLELAEALWDSAADDSLPVPAEHKKLLRSRRAAFERGEMKTIPMEELKQSLRRRT